MGWQSGDVGTCTWLNSTFGRHCMQFGAGARSATAAAGARDPRPLAPPAGDGREDTRQLLGLVQAALYLATASSRSVALGFCRSIAGRWSGWRRWSRSGPPAALSQLTWLASSEANSELVMGLQSGNVAPAHASTAEGPPSWPGTAHSLAQMLELLMLLKPVLLKPVLLMPVLLMPVPPPHVISSRWLLLPVTAATTHASFQTCHPAANAGSGAGCRLPRSLACRRFPSPDVLGTSTLSLVPRRSWPCALLGAAACVRLRPVQVLVVSLSSR